MEDEKLSNEGNESKEANTCIGLGLGVGALGVAAATLSGAMCPLCIVIAPALIGIGIARKIAAVEPT